MCRSIIHKNNRTTYNIDYYCVMGSWYGQCCRTRLPSAEIYGDLFCQFLDYNICKMCVQKYQSLLNLEKTNLS
uniref:Uncharacterized protein n=1 Tax=Anguilla anguilla TaxID=7936 RepID=A0A0E9WQL5_ANGAN